jgi:hypothetical protein
MNGHLQSTRTFGIGLGNAPWALAVRCGCRRRCLATQSARRGIVDTGSSRILAPRSRCFLTWLVVPLALVEPTGQTRAREITWCPERQTASLLSFASAKLCVRRPCPCPDCRGPVREALLADASIGSHCEALAIEGSPARRLSRSEPCGDEEAEAPVLRGCGYGPLTMDCRDSIGMSPLSIPTPLSRFWVDWGGVTSAGADVAHVHWVPMADCMTLRQRRLAQGAH